MEHHAVKVAGLGFRAQASVASLRSALRAADADTGLSALATAEDKAGAAVLLQLAAELGLPVIAVPLAKLQAQAATSSTHVPVRYGSHSLAEAAAMAAVGPSARLLVARAVSADRLATAAIAENTKL
ncbi:cobalamin biosynthesis protein [Rhodoferax sp.]|uniref:cobalamin biosynthesis protein n=1 Tax=Rhodoferax sp. TaxID=50421 RepID=UPI00374DF455